MTKEKLLSMKAIAEKEFARGDEGENISFSPREALQLISAGLAWLEMDKVLKEREEIYRKGVLGLSNPGTTERDKENTPK